MLVQKPGQGCAVLFGVIACLFLLLALSTLIYGTGICSVGFMVGNIRLPFFSSYTYFGKCFCAYEVEKYYCLD